MAYLDAIANLQKSREAANKANQKRLTEALGYYDQLVDIFSPGGDYGKSLEASLAIGKRGSVSTGMQNLVSSGMANTQMAAGLGTAFEQQVANPARLQLEDVRLQRLSEALMGKAGTLERVQDYGPSDELVSSNPANYTTRTITNTPSESLWARSNRLHESSASPVYGQSLGTIYGSKYNQRGSTSSPVTSSSSASSSGGSAWGAAGGRKFRYENGKLVWS